MVVPTLRVQCTARSHRTGQRCRRWATNGATVCQVHGAGAPQVKRKAEERIRELVNPALALIAEILETGRAEDLPASVSLAAARDILDRAGYTATQKLAVTGDLTIRSPVDVELDSLAEMLREHDRSRVGDDDETVR
jgi:hypothetical protein